MAQGDLGLELAVQPDGRGVDPDGGVVEQALVDVADLLDVQGPVRQPLGLGRAGAAALAAQHLEGVEQVQDGPVVDRYRLVGGGHAGLAAL